MNKLALLTTFFAGAFVLGQPAKALQITTPFIPFSNTNLNTQSRSPATLTFPTFNTLYSGPGILKSVGYKLAANDSGTGAAATTQKLTFVGNNGDLGSYATVNKISYQLNLRFNNSVVINGVTASTTSTAASTPAVPNTVPFGNNQIFTLNGTYSGTSVFTGNLTPAQVNMFNSGSTVSTTNTSSGYSVNWGDTSDFSVACYGPSSPSYEADCADPGGYYWGSVGLSNNATTRAKLSGYIALVYDYEEPPAATPSPLPMIGAGAAFGWSRKMRKRILAAG
jgi:hypothetical protein